ncbi:MAG: TrkA family potassium uptake protein [Chloroflexota bacterium]|nr:TrkA family potassium uptake protein [Chloroflexota bacterium]MDE2903856.1 TrkA family potassium uptake protein [Chloroflexota bacterium]MDE2918712.1 TrkA family potassium uptake protein [Chloroflexota bacterium]
MYAIVIGCGRAGAEIASRMCEQGHSVVVVDRDRAAFHRLSDSFSGTTIVGHAIDEDCLVSAGIERADAVIATTYGDNSNLIAVQLARKRFNVERAIARVKDSVRASAFAKLGFETIPSTVIVGDAFEQALGWDPPESNGPTENGG